MRDVPLAPGSPDVLEVGGQWLGPTQDRALALVRELGLATYATFDTGDRIFEVEGRAPGRYRGRIPRVSPLAVADFAQAQLRLDRAARRVPLEAPWSAPAADRLDGETLAGWMRRTMRTKLGREMMRLACVAVFCVEPEELSLLHVLFYVRAGGGLDSLLDTGGGAQQDRVVGGPAKLARLLADELGDRVWLEEPVRRIDQDADGVLVTSDGASVRAGAAIVTIPPALSGRIQHDPPLPASRDGVSQRMPMGAVIKLNVVYDRPFWREAGLSGQATSLIGPVGIAFDNSPPTGAAGVLVAFVEGRHARELPADRRRTAVLEQLARLFGPAAATPVDVVEQDWTAEEHVRGAYAGVFAPGVWTSYGPGLRAPVGRVHWAGTETATRWMGYIDGAISSGERSARDVVGVLASRAAR